MVVGIGWVAVATAVCVLVLFFMPLAVLCRVCACAGRPYSPLLALGAHQGMRGDRSSCNNGAQKACSAQGITSQDRVEQCFLAWKHNGFWAHASTSSDHLF